MQHIHIVDVNLTRDEFTRHGLHLNYLGKERIAKTIEQSINTLSMTRNPTISLNWKEVPSAAITTAITETRMESTRKKDIEIGWGQQRKMTLTNKEMQRDLHADRRDPLQLEMKIFYG